MDKSSSSENIRVSRIKTLLKEKNITQEELAGMIPVPSRNGKDPSSTMEPQNLSRCLTSGKISEKLCRKIHEAFPEIRIAWLLGDDEYMTEYDWADSVQDMKNRVADSMWGIIENSLRKEGKSLKFVHRTGQHVDSSQRLRADCYYSIVDRSGKELKRLTALEMVQFEEKIQEYCDFMTGKYL